MRSRMKPRERRQEILMAAVTLTKRRRSLDFTRFEVAEEAGTSEALVSRYFGTMHQMRRAVARYGSLTSDVAVLAVAAMSEKYKVEIPDKVRPYVLEYLNEQLGE